MTTTNGTGRMGPLRARANPERTDALARTIAARLRLCSEDELRVVDVVLGRLELGRDRYGQLDLARPRDWERELAEELLDAHIYRACALLVERENARADLHAAAAAEREQAAPAPALARHWLAEHDAGDEG